ncbi:MAG: SAM-dependent methyltransferase, partial [Nitrospirae bacterium]|nr:SAM-dependent methyltransferase [Nitrospirota bacterium]
EALLLQFNGKVKWAASHKDLTQFIGCVLSNELVDAFPVHLVKVHAGGIYEVFIDEGFNEILMPAGEKIKEYLTEFAPSLMETLPDGYTTEVDLDSIEWMDNITTSMERGFIFTIDYGYPAYEYYSLHRTRGTLLCYYRHEVSENPYQRVGQQDITAHVNFSSLKKLGDERGFKTIGYCPQGIFLVSMRIDEFLLTLADKEDYQFDALKVKRLLLPEGMGESHKVLIQYKGEGIPTLSGFSMRNMANTL